MIELLGHQRAALERFAEVPRLLLDYGVGTGKTVIGLKTIEQGGTVLCPAGLRPVWHQQVAQHGFEPFSGSRRLISYSMAPKVLAAKGSLPVDLPVVCEEAHRLKGRKTGWTVAVEKAAAGRRMLLMTGTPIAASPVDAYMLLRLLFPGDRRFTSYWRWIDEWFSMEYNRHTGMMSTVGPLKRSAEDFADQFGDRYLFASTKDMIPGLQRQVFMVDMLPAQRKMYDKLRLLWQIDVEGCDPILFDKPGSFHARLLQICAGTSTQDASTVSDAKLDMLMDLLDCGGGEPCVIFVRFRSVAEAIERRLGQQRCVGLHGGVRLADRQQNAARFQSGDVPYVVVSYAAGAEGWNLQRSRWMVRVESPFTPGQDEQSIGRIHRFGQLEPCLVQDLVASNSADSVLRERLATSVDRAAAVTSALRKKAPEL